MKVCNWDGVGSLKEDKEIISDHIGIIFNLVNPAHILKKKPRLILDCNGAGAVITPLLLKKLGCQVTSINTGLEGFSRPSEPNEANLRHLMKMVVETGADFALAHDGDADRIVVIDNTGNILPLDVQLAIMIEHELQRKKGRIISTVEASLNIRDIVESNGGSIEITPVGSTYVADELEKTNAVFGGEPCGEYIYGEGVHVPDAILGAAKLVEIFCEKGKFSEIRKQYKQNFMHRDKFMSTNKSGVVASIKKEISIDGKIRTDDGLRIDEEDGWFLVRASGTEPAVRLTMEYETKERLEKRKKELVGILTKCLDTPAYR